MNPEDYVKSMNGRFRYIILEVLNSMSKERLAEVYSAVLTEIKELKNNQG